ASRRWPWSRVALRRWRKSIVSRWSSESLLIALFPARVVAVKHARGWRARVIGRRVVETANSPAAADHAHESGSAARSGTTAWKMALAALDESLTGFAEPGTRATVVVSSRFVRYTVVPWSDNVITAPEQFEFARHCFQALWRNDSRVGDQNQRRRVPAQCAGERCRFEDAASHREKPGRAGHSGHVDPAEFHGGLQPFPPPVEGLRERLHCGARARTRGARHF